MLFIDHVILGYVTFADHDCRVSSFHFGASPPKERGKKRRERDFEYYRPNIINRHGLLLLVALLEDDWSSSSLTMHNYLQGLPKTKKNTKQSDCMVDTITIAGPCKNSRINSCI